MVPAVNEVMLVIGSSLVASVVIKVTITMALGFVAVWLGRGNRAAVRHAVLAAIFGVILLLPIASIVVPPLHVGVPVGVESRAALPFLVSARDAEPSATSAETSQRALLVEPRALKLSFS